MNLLDDFSRLNNLKQSRGLFQDTSNSISGYLLERKVLRILEEEVPVSHRLTLAQQLGVSGSDLNRAVESSAYSLTEPQLRALLCAYLEDGLNSMIQLLITFNS